jgi:hypothetical protein
VVPAAARVQALCLLASLLDLCCCRLYRTRPI